VFKAAPILPDCRSTTFLHPLGVAGFAAAADYSYFATDCFTSCVDDFVSAIIGSAAMAEYFIISVTTLSSWRTASSPHPAPQFGAEIVAASFVFRRPKSAST
jgi:hypothetical protein